MSLKSFIMAKPAKHTEVQKFFLKTFWFDPMLFIAFGCFCVLRCGSLCYHEISLNEKPLSHFVANDACFVADVITDDEVFLVVHKTRKNIIEEFIFLLCFWIHKSLESTSQNFEFLNNFFYNKKLSSKTSFNKIPKITI